MRCYVDMLLITSTANIKTWERDNGLYGGLFPLVRGTLGIGAIAALCVRFIPASAGNSVVRSIPWDHLTVYPRWRGELTLLAKPDVGLIGLSPLARGTPGTIWTIRTGDRFIPAGAGNSFSYVLSVQNYAVYPRWRGELLIKLLISDTDGGLSPLARGTRL